MPIMIGAVSGLMNGLGIGLFSKGEIALGIGWFMIGLAVAWALYMRVSDEQKALMKAKAHRDNRH